MHERREGSWRAKPSACRSVWDIFRIYFWLVYVVSELYMCMYMWSESGMRGRTRSGGDGSDTCGRIRCACRNVWVYYRLVYAALGLYM